MGHHLQQYFLIVVCGGVVVAALTSCFMADPNGATNPTAISREGNSLLIAVCTDARVTNIRVEGNNSSGWKELFTAAGDSVLHSGDTFTTESSLPGFTSSVSVAPDFDQMSAFSILMTDTDADMTVSAASFGTPSTGVPEGKWLQWDGTISEEPCP